MTSSEEIKMIVTEFIEYMERKEEMKKVRERMMKAKEETDEL